MESQSIVDSSTPLLKEVYAYGVVEHPFPLNCFIRDWDLGPAFYHAVKVGIVQYVCTLFPAETLFQQVFFFLGPFQPYLVFSDLLFFQMILKLICALLAMILQSFGVYGEGKFDWRYG